MPRALPSATMPARTRAFTALLDLVRRGDVDTLSLEQIQARRVAVFPARPPFTWITGVVSPRVTVGELDFAARDGARIPVRVYRPQAAGPLPTVVYFHGGGWVLGTPRGYDPLCSFLADEVGALVLSVDYRLAPEHVAPVAALDCVDAVRWVTDQAQRLGVDPARLAVCGDSAGANLSAVVAQVLRDEGGAQLAYQALLYPGVDATMSHPSIAEHANAPVLTRHSIVAFLDRYLGGSGLDPTDPLVSPLWAGDLTGLPPALVQTADLDPLRDEGQAYASRLAAAGVPVRATNYLGAPHGFMSFPGATTCGAQARLELVTELRAHLQPDPS